MSYRPSPSACQTSAVAPLTGSPFRSLIVPSNTSFSPTVPGAARSPPDGTSCESVVKNGPSSQLSVAPCGLHQCADHVHDLGAAAHGGTRVIQLINQHGQAKAVAQQYELVLEVAACPVSGDGRRFPSRTTYVLSLPARVSQSIVVAHSACVGVTSRANAWRCLVSALKIVRRRADGHSASVRRVTLRASRQLDRIRVYEEGRTRR
jgi:hypothetical protein